MTQMTQIALPGPQMTQMTQIELTGPQMTPIEYLQGPSCPNEALVLQPWSTKVEQQRDRVI